MIICGKNALDGEPASQLWIRDSLSSVLAVWSFELVWLTSVLECLWCDEVFGIVMKCSALFFFFFGEHGQAMFMASVQAS